MKTRKVVSEYEEVIVKNECMHISDLIRVACESDLGREASCVSMTISYELTPCTSDFQRNLYMFFMGCSLYRYINSVMTNPVTMAVVKTGRF